MTTKRKMTWPNWETAAAGTRVEEVTTKRKGTFVKRAGRNGSGRVGDGCDRTGAVVDWDDVGFGVSRGRVAGACYCLRPIEG